MEGARSIYILDGVSLNTVPKRRLEAFRSIGFAKVIVICRGGAAQPGMSVSVPGMAVQVEGLRGNDPELAKAIREMVERESVSLVSVVMNRDGQKRLRRSLAGRLLLSSTVPVLLWPGGYEPPPPEEGTVFSHVIYATDWSTSSDKAFEYILRFKESIMALEIVHVVSTKLSVREMRAVKRRLTETREKFVDAGIDAESHVYAGKRAKEVVLATRDYNATCIVMKGNGNGRVRWWLGMDSVSQVLKHSPVAVLAVP
jgi:nucleotide-binding universal stress UspA family protein